MALNISSMDQTVVPMPNRHPSEQRYVILSSDHLLEAGSNPRLLRSIEARSGFSKQHYRRCFLPVIHAYADFVQQIPVCSTQDPARPRTLLERTLQIVDVALAYRRGQILPRGVAPEDVMRLEHRWTYAVMVAAALHEIKRVQESIIVLRGGLILNCAVWIAVFGPMSDSGAAEYSVIANGSTCSGPRSAKLGERLLEKWLAQDVISWLTADSDVYAELVSSLAEDHKCGSAIRQLVLRATTEIDRTRLTVKAEDETSITPKPRDENLESTGANSTGQMAGPSTSPKMQKLTGRVHNSAASSPVLISAPSNRRDNASGEEYLEDCDSTRPRRHGKPTVAKRAGPERFVKSKRDHDSTT